MPLFLFINTQTMFPENLTPWWDLNSGLLLFLRRVSHAARAWVCFEVFRVSQAGGEDQWHHQKHQEHQEHQEQKILVRIPPEWKVFRENPAQCKTDLILHFYFVCLIEKYSNPPPSPTPA
jgi:hypothetical protein